MEDKREIYTIGHSTRDLKEFIDLLLTYKIELLVDVRNFPGSRKYPHFSKESLEVSLKEYTIDYLHLKPLGGRRKPQRDSRNDRWRNEAFRGYADYMESTAFKESIAELEEIALDKKVAYMCSEAVWWRCHRGLISDYLKNRGWKVLHILSPKKAEEHPYTSAARIINSHLSYSSPSLFE